MRGAVLVVGEGRCVSGRVSTSLRARGYRAIEEPVPTRAIERAHLEDHDLVLVVMPMPSVDGFALSARFVETRPDRPVIAVMESPTDGDVARGIALGAAAVLDQDGIDEAELEAAIERHRPRRISDVAPAPVREGAVQGDSPAMRAMREVIRRIAPTHASVLITGESGTGKERVAKAIHEESARRAGPFVALNCAAVPASLLESELFGHERGAFTDARGARRGLFLDAQGGTLFLDEVGDMPPDMQVKLLRALQERCVRPVGGSAEIPFDARVIAATNRDLEAEVAARRFREDLYYRIHVCTVHVPSLREREGDVLALADGFLRRFAEKNQKDVSGFTPGARARLVAWRWPGNVRELENAIERAVALAQHELVEVDDLPESVRGARRGSLDALLPASLSELVTMDELKRRYMWRVLDLVGGNKSQAARILGFHRRTLYRELGERPASVPDPQGTPRGR